MVKERLFISEKLVRVDYEFLNTAKEPVASEVAFPIPLFKYVFEDLGGRRDFSDFKAWVDGRPISIANEIKAFANGRDITNEIKRADITIDRFGYFDISDESALKYEVKKLSPALREELVSIGALKKPETGKSDDPWAYAPLWEAQIIYHWMQVFPPGHYCTCSARIPACYRV